MLSFALVTCYLVFSIDLFLLLVKSSSKWSQEDLCVEQAQPMSCARPGPRIESLQARYIPGAVLCPERACCSEAVWGGGGPASLRRPGASQGGPPAE